MSSLPTGTVTFLFTDIEGSTRRWEAFPELMREALARHDAILRDAIERHRGAVVKTVGDAFHAAFATAIDGLETALEAQRALTTEAWKDGVEIRVRMALHTGAAEERDNDYFGSSVNRAARLLPIAYPGQILVSGVTQELVREELPQAVTLLDLGEHALKDLTHPEHIYQVVAPGIPLEFPALKTADTRPNNLPVQASSFVGRQEEVASLRAMFLREGARLVTLTGPGGTGKTRLAVTAASELLDAFDDGVFFVSLASIGDAQLVPSAVASALGVPDSGNRSIVETLGTYLRNKDVLLILDNFEHVLDAASIVPDLLAAPKVRVLVTSQSVLRLSGERVLPVPPLVVPDPKHLPDVDTLAKCSAIALFMERARAVRPDLALTAENADTITQICYRLDGLPLAIELAAARIRLFPPQALLERLQSRLQLLTGGARDLPTRQQTLRGAIEWSYSLLDAAEQRLFARLAVFAGGCTLEAAEDVCGRESDLGIEVLDGIASLVEKSLLRQEGETEPRFVMLGTIRELARERLEEHGEVEELSRRHAAYFTALADTADTELHGAQQVIWLRRLDAEYDNIRAALAWGVDRDDATVAMQLAGSLSEYWLGRGLASEGRAWLGRALEATQPDDRSSARAAALLGVGMLASSAVDFKVGLPQIQEAVQLWKEIGNRRKLGRALFLLGIYGAAAGNSIATGPHLVEAQKIAVEENDGWVKAAALSALGMTSMMEGEYATARGRFEESVALVRKRGDATSLVYVLNQLGDVARLQRNFAEAQEHYQESLNLSQTIGMRGAAPSLQHNLAWVAYHMGEEDRAAELFRKAMISFREMADDRGMAECLIGFGVLWSARQLERAARFFGAAEAAFEERAIRLSSQNQLDYDRSLAEVRSKLDEEAFRRAWGSGHSLTLDEAVAEVLAS
jgi:predicted ATPase/class 3 adenylate cyclase